MGCDIHVALGKIKPLAIGYERKGTAIKLAGLGDDLDFSQFEFLDYDDDCGWESDRLTKEREIDRNYDLFAWLAGVRGDLEPVIPKENLEKLHTLTYEFQKWANNEDRRLRQEQYKLHGMKAYYSQHQPDWSDKFVTGDHSHVIYPLLFLRGFDYDQQVKVQAQDEWETLDQYLSRLEEYRGQTYRQVFGQRYLNFLDWSLENGWQFVIFTFDS